jgi:hypothetical protein
MSQRKPLFWQYRTIGHNYTIDASRGFATVELPNTLARLRTATQSRHFVGGQPFSCRSSPTCWPPTSDAIAGACPA